ncbi:hypothetical protein COCNU_07G015600 [Cocos nucifera]|uniref:Uncharacterized protein n=1 Tax=Cocos nucifera TaxID=13894 RepID=A0A8K0IGQ3_COCNU|nr:hypothetical protein COCNU_07G015600 [Cocos nucifera]
MTMGRKLNGSRTGKEVANTISSEEEELKKLLSEQSLFNMGISQVGLEGMDLSLPKISGPKTLRKRRAELAGGKFAHARVGLLPAPPSSELENLKPSSIDAFKIMRIPHGSSSPILEGGQRSPVECLFNKAILSLPALDVTYLFPKEEPIEVAGISRIALTGVQLIEAARITGAMMVEVQFTKAARTSGTVPAGVQLEALP